MIRGPVWDAHTQSQHVWTTRPAHATAMPRPQGSRSPHTLIATTTTGNNNNRSLVLDLSTNNDNNTIISTNNSGGDQAGTSYREADVSTAARTTEDYSKLKEQFYQSYNPQVGVHTAAVLGGILGWLIVYLLYKTKVKRWVVDLAKNRYAKHQQRRKEKEVREVFAEFEDHDLNPDPYLFHSPHMTDLHVQQLLQQGFWQPDQLSQHADCTSHPQDYNPHLQDYSFHLQDYNPHLQDYNPHLQDHNPHLQDYNPHLQDYCSQQEGDRYTEDRALPFPQCPACGVFAEDSMSRHKCPMPSIVVDSYKCVPPEGVAAGNSAAHNQESLQQDCRGDNPLQADRKRGKGQRGKERKKKYRRRRSRSQGRVVPGVRVMDVEDLDTKALLPPPCSHSDTTRATARWIQNMPLLMRSQQDVNGLILKVQQHMLGDQKQLSCPLISTALHYAALPVLGVPHSGYNNSMPVLPSLALDYLKDVGSFRGVGSVRSLDSMKGVDTLPGPGSLQVLDSVTRNGDALLSRDDRRPDVEDEEVHLLQPAPCCAASQPKLSLSHPGWRHEQPPFPSLSSSLSLKSPSSRLPSLLPKHSHVSSSATNLTVPGSGMLMTSSYSAPTSPVPIPVTPTITILHNVSNVRGGRGLCASVPRPDSDLSLSSSSSFDPLTLAHLQPDCACGQQLSQQSHIVHVPSGSKTSSRASWTLFEDDDDDKMDKLSGVGDNICQREEGVCSRQTSCRSDLSSPSVRHSCNTGRCGPHDTVLTVETKL